MGKIKDSDDLNLPEAPDFISKEPVRDISEMIRSCEAMLPYWNKLRITRPLPVRKMEPFKLQKEDL